MTKARDTILQNIVSPRSKRGSRRSLRYTVVFQALRFRHNEDLMEHIRAQPSALGAREEAEKYSAHQRRDWNDVCLAMMDWVIQMRILQYPDFADVLDATRDAEVILNDQVS